MAKKTYFILIKKKSLLTAIMGLAVCLTVIILVANFFSGGGTGAAAFEQSKDGYVILGENDLGMHCYHSDFSSFLIIPPGNTLKVQVFKKGGEKAELVNSGITVSYEILNNTTSADKINFWQYAKDYGYNTMSNTGITGNGLTGNFKLSSDGKYYEASMIPVTPYNDNSSQPNPYQMAKVTVSDSKTGQVLASTDKIVVPVSDEMLCSNCHGKDNTDQNILAAHDKLSGTSLVSDLKNGIRHKCADCHKDNGLGLAGKTGIEPLSQAMHGFHASKMELSSVTPACYNCHPGPVTKCNRGVMDTAGISCDSQDCHGDMANLASTQASGREGWLQEPDCANCHGAQYAVNPNTLYRNSYLTSGPNPMNGVIQCETCHNSTHAEWPSALPADNLLPFSLMGTNSFIYKCTVCHAGQGTIHTSGPG